MKRFMLFLSVLFVLSISPGCKIASSLPDTSNEIIIGKTDKVSFSVEGPAEGAALRYSWQVIMPLDEESAIIEEIGRGRELLFDIGMLTHVSNKIKLRCSLYQFGPVSECNGSVICKVEIKWSQVDCREWDIRLIQDPPVWDGNYIINSNADQERLEGFSTVTGNLCLNGLVTELNSLNGLQAVGEDMRIIRTDLVGVQGLDNISMVGHDLIIDSNPLLVDLGGLSGLKTIGWHLIFSMNDSMSGLGLDSLMSVGMNNPPAPVDGHGIFEIISNRNLCNTLVYELRDQVLGRGGINGEILIDNADCP